MTAATITRKSDGLLVSRHFGASRERVFAALSDADQLRQWWGPPSHPVVDCSVDFRPGGVWHYGLRGVTDGVELWARSVYQQIVPPERISYLERSSDADGRVTEERPAAFVTITLGADETGTTLAIDIRYQSPLDRERAIRSGVESGLSRALDALDQLLTNGKKNTMSTVASKDGTTIAYETLGDGPPIILVDGAMCFRASGPMRPIGRELASAFTVVLYDRRGRGQSGDTQPSTVDRELEDLDALIAAVGGPVSLFGISSGAALSLRAAVALGPKRVDRLVMFEPPYLPEEFLDQAARYTADLTRALSEGRPGDALETFMRHVGVPEQGIVGARQSPTWEATVALAQTLAYDDAVMGDSRVPTDAALVSIPTLTLASAASPPMLHHGPQVAALAIPGATFELVDGTFHEPDPAALATRVADFAQLPVAQAGS